MTDTRETKVVNTLRPRLLKVLLYVLLLGVLGDAVDE